MALIGQAGVNITITNNHPACFHCRTDHLLQQLGPGGSVGNTSVFNEMGKCRFNSNFRICSPAAVPPVPLPAGALFLDWLVFPPAVRRGWFPEPSIPIEEINTAKHIPPSYLTLAVQTAPEKLLQKTVGKTILRNARVSVCYPGLLLKTVIGHLLGNLHAVGMAFMETGTGNLDESGFC